MAEFVQIMKDWRRMCQHMDKIGGDRSCDICPLSECNAIYEDDGNTDYADIEEKVATWAAEHPEPVYPAWGDWLRDLYGNPQMTMTDILESPIDPEIAQRLNIVPRRKRNGENQESQCHIR